MSVPLDRLYNHLDGLCNHDVVIYRFFPHGSKKLTDLTPLHNVYANDTWSVTVLKPMAICHDQEPLFFEQYDVPAIKQLYLDTNPGPLPYRKDIQNRMHDLIEKQRLRAVIASRHSIYDKTLLVHSERHSANLEAYESHGFIGVYWWTHAALAADWFRYAEHDVDLIPCFDNIQKDFLIYNRAWSGTREYRLKFLESLANQNLQHHCCTSFSPICDNLHYKDHCPSNAVFTVRRNDLHDIFMTNSHSSVASADYTSEDYKTCAIEVALETLFDDDRWHLTEKSLRPIACGRPFILASTARSLQYLKSYGFKTFAPWIDESYDQITHPLERLQAIVKELQRLATLDRSQKVEIWHRLYEIAAYNKKLFFNRSWQQSIFDEFTNNMRSSMSLMKTFKTGRHWQEAFNLWKSSSSPELEFGHWDPMLQLSFKHCHDVTDQLNLSSTAD